MTQTTMLRPAQSPALWLPSAANEDAIAAPRKAGPDNIRAFNRFMASVTSRPKTSKVTRSLLDLVDWQYDFLAEDGACSPPSPAGRNAARAFKKFIGRVTPRHEQKVLAKFDTHFIGEYPHSEEAKLFERPHTLFNTKGQRLYVELCDLADRIPLFYMNKNEFDMWGQNPTDISRVPFSSAEEKLAYQNLFCVTPKFNDLTPGTPRDLWLAQNGITPENTTITVAGIYMDFCTEDDVKGWLKRGFRVNLLTDLCPGIGGHPERSGRDLSGSPDAVCAQHFERELRTGQLRKMTSEQWLMG